MQQISTIAFTLIIAAYPLAMYFGGRQLNARALGYGLLAVAAIRLLTLMYDVYIHAEKFKTSKALPAVGLFLVAILAILHNSKSVLHAYPIMINAAMLVIFALSLRWPPTIIERIARLSEPALDASGVLYTRRVTQVWCVFFLANGAIASWTVALGDEKIWALYNGLIAYLLMGALLGSEWLVRQRLRSADR